jgi:FtsP/CotA-like multicopper oxidase with cupredoxin domain
MRIPVRSTVLGVAMMGAVLVTVTAAPAEAVWVPPSPSALVDVNGVANGCTVSASVTKSFLPGFEDQGRGVLITVTPTCPASANVHRLVDGLTVQLVGADGSLTTTSSGEIASLQSSTISIVGSFPASQFTPCANPDVRGTHTYRVVARVAAKVQPTWLDPHPFVGKAGAVATITCP